MWSGMGTIWDMPLPSLSIDEKESVSFGNAQRVEKRPVQRMAGWTDIPAEVVQADDARAIVSATSTNLIQRQELSIIERGKAFRALLDAKNRQGYRTDRNAATSGENRQKFDDKLESTTSGDSRQKYSARALVAEFFGVTEYEIRKAVKLTYLIPELADILENNPKQLNLACADLIADYDTKSQQENICQGGFHPKDEILPINRKLSYTSVRVTAAF